jgi:hypothetical protein
LRCRSVRGFANNADMIGAPARHINDMEISLFRLFAIGVESWIPLLPHH